MADAISIDEVKEVRDQSEAMRAYAKQAKNKQLEVQAAEIRIRAERRIGELMAAQRADGNMATAGRPSQEIGSKTNPISKAPTLSEVGIDKKLADRARKYAAIPEGEFDGIVGEWREKVEEENKRVTVNLLAAGDKAEKAAPSQTQDTQEDNPKLRAEYRRLSDEAREDEWVNLRLSDAEQKKRIAAQRSEIADLKQQVKELSDADDPARKLAAKHKQLLAANFKRDEAMTTAKRFEYRMKQAEKERDEMRRQFEAQEIAL
jgi:hypothetical protein